VDLLLSEVVARQIVKNVGIPEYYLGGNVELLGDSWKIKV
jgi:hypothetical protein